MKRLFFILLVACLLPLGCGSELSRFGITPATDDSYYTVASTQVVDLGQKLFFDKILSGNQNISCATCHHPTLSTADALSLGVGEGGTGLGTKRTTGAAADAIHERVPRNAPGLFNIGAKEYVTFFHDGRVEIDASLSNGFRNPADSKLPTGLDNVLAVQALFPVTSPTEMAGQDSENAQAAAAKAGNLTSVWNHIVIKLKNIPAYVSLFQSAFGLASANDITISHVANALAAFEAKFYRSDNAPFDVYLRGDDEALSETALAGAELFYGKAACSVCHSGVFQTDHKFYNLAIPQIGPGKGDGTTELEDYGRERVTEVTADRYKFRVPSLRNVALTGPWGHDGAYSTLRAVILHHFDPTTSLQNYDRTQVVMPSRTDLDAIDFTLLDNATYRTDVLSTAVQVNVTLTEEEMVQLLAFLDALTDPNMLDRTSDIPSSVPSGLPVAD